MSSVGDRWSTRAFVSLMIALSSLGLAVTGIAGHVYEHDGLTVPRHAVMASHAGLAFLFSVFSTWHVVVNRRALWSHLRSAARRVVSREALAAAAIVAVILLLTVGHAFHGGGTR